MPITVIYHSADLDGVFCREIAKKFLPHDPNCDVNNRPPEGITKPCNCTNYIGWNFGDAPLMALQGADGLGEIFVMDLPIDRPFGFEFSNLKRGETWRKFLGEETRLTWIDHHKSSIDSHPKDIPGYRIDGVAACRLAWQWFLGGNTSAQKQHYVARKVREPLAVRLAGEYDVWDHRGDGDLELQFGLRSIVPTRYEWSLLLNPESTGDEFTRKLIEAGAGIMTYTRNVDEGNMKASFLIKWEDLTFLCLNGRGNSNTFASRDVPETGHDALLMFYFNGDQWIVSLYHAKHRTDLDLSQIAVKYGGGGHRGACGFTSVGMLPPFL